MRLKELLGRISGYVSVSTGALLVICFFLPWVKLSCAGTDVGTASGLQLTVGKMSMSKDFEEMSSMGESLGGADAEQEKDDKGPKARPWFLLGLIVPLGLLWIGVKTFREVVDPEQSGKWMLGLGVVGIIVMIMAFSVDYASEMKEEGAERPAPAARGPDMGFGDMTKGLEKATEAQVKTETLGTVSFSLILYILVGACGAGAMFVPEEFALGGAPADEGGTPPPAA